MKTSTFVRGLIVCLAAMIAFGGVLGLLNHGRSRPEGVAENWLTAVGDTTRKGVESDAKKRAEKIGSLRLVDARLVRPNPDHKSAFDDIEVGKAIHQVPVDCRICQPAYSPLRNLVWSVAFRVHARRGSELVEVRGFIQMAKTNDRVTQPGEDWHVLSVSLLGDKNTVGDPETTGLMRGVPALPSDGGPPPSSAPISLWLGGLVGAAIIGVVTSLLVRAAGRPAPVPATA